ncbi:alpha/beta fold hydrolase [Blastochloris sulfoviridis]|uniref:Alpha/beta fold hydrolase n=2 Tax=Blastochloris sulfoviridis TaxID=50712 RepID=A0A5M6HZ90_9HYPH|nr:alpha/beta fold hydrolase [Blastochloris sulfoviridis]
MGADVVAGEEEPAWTSANRIRLDLPTLRLRDFSTGAAGRPVLVVAPFALHTAAIADLAPGHSLMERLAIEGIARLALTDWKSATPAMSDFTLDTYLADLNVAVDECGPPVDLVGLCQGGSLALIYAARFPGKVRALVPVAAPVDTAVGESDLAAWAKATPLATFAEIVRQCGGRMRGRAMRNVWPRIAGQLDAYARRDLQLDPGDDRPHARAALERYAAWDRILVDLPGRYYLQTVEWLFQRNLLAEGAVPALGHTVGLERIRHPLFLVAGENDVIAPPAQVFAAARLAGTARSAIASRLWPGGHLSLFMGAQNLATGWPEAARWLAATDRRHAAGRSRARTPRVRAPRTVAHAEPEAAE